VRNRDRFLLALSVVAALGAFVLWRDLSLPERARQTAKTQVLIENLQLEREISGDLFRVQAKEARKLQDERVEASSLDVDANLRSGDRWQMRAASGSLETHGEIRLSDVFATNLRKGPDLDLEAKTVRWNPERRRWDLEGGITLRQGDMRAGGNSGMADPNGRVTLSGEAWATWQKP
jgi:hypothetical protein